MSTTRMRRSDRNIFRTKNPITNKILKSIHVWVFASMAFCGLLFSQQAQKEYIYLGGRTIAVESRSISPLTIAITSPTLESSYDTGSSSITLGGTASSQATSVIWTNSRGGNGSCTGTTSWSCSITGLQAGTNLLTVTALKGENGFASDSLTVYYCTYTISPASAGIMAGAGSGSVALTASYSGCRWTAGRSVNWIQFAPGGSATASGTGSSVVNYTVDANAGPERTGTLTIAGQTHTVTQASGCASISPTIAQLMPNAQSGSIGVTGASGCTWTATVTSVANPQWLTVTSGASGNGNGTVGYSVTANSGATRTGVITIGGRTFTARQVSSNCVSQCTAAADACAAGGACVIQCIEATCPMNPSVCGPYCQAMCAGQGGGTDCTAVYNQCLEGCND
jgi:hypothetical protein